MVEKIWGERGGFGMWERFVGGEEMWDEMEKEVQGAVMNMMDGREEEQRKMASRKVNSLAKGEWHPKWREARDELTTEEVRWVERARAGVLEVAEETGRWEGIAREDRVCPLCQGEVETGAHALGVCPALIQARWESERELAKVSGGVLTKMTEAMREIEDNGKKRKEEGRLCSVDDGRRRLVLRAMNRGIARIMQLRAHLMQEKERALEGKEAEEWRPRREGGLEVNDHEVEEAIQRQTKYETKRRKKPRKVPRPQRGGREVGDSNGGTGKGDVEWMETEQKINVRGIERWLASDEVKTEKERSCAQAVLMEASKRNGWLRQRYRRSVEGGRWHATGKAQLQSSSRKVRAIALEGQGLEIDMDNAHITLLIAAAEVAKGGGSREWRWLQSYAENKGKGRRQVAEGFGTTAEAAKNLFFTLMFGGTVQSWARRWNVGKEKTCEFKNQSEGAKMAYGFAGDVKKASHRVMEGKGRNGEKRATTLQ